MKYIISIAILLWISLTQATGQIIPNGTTAPQLSLPTVPAAYPDTVELNMIRVWESRKAVTGITPTDLSDNSKYKTATQYLDGLGRPLQTVVKGNNYNGTKDIVSINIYDELGHEAKQYLSYAPASNNNGKFRGNPFAEQQTYYHTNYQDQTPFAKTDFEASPLNKPFKNYSQGNNWAGNNRGVEQKIEFNTVDDNVKTTTIGFNAGSTPLFGVAYAQGMLVKLSKVDEHGKKTIEYKDKDDQLILRKVQLDDVPGISHNGWLCTYYIYDDLGQLRFVLQPKAVAELLVNGWLITAALRDELCFVYEYDAKDRMIYKKTPGTAAIYMCYDTRDRLVYKQDGNQLNQNKWTVTFYDELNRPLSTALYNTTQSQSQLQAGLDALTASNPVPTITESLLTRLSYSYYDEYIMPGQAAYNQDMVNGAQATASAGDEEMENLAKTELVRGMVTGVQIRVLGTATLLKTTTYYDTKDRVLQNHSTNIKGGTDATTMAYSFTGKVLSSYLQHNNTTALLPGTQTTHVYTHNVYNNDYLLKTEKKINDEGWKRIAEMEYDDMGEPKKKMMGNPVSNFYVNMDYNIRGWLTGINKTAQQNLENGSIGVSTFYDAIFSEVLHYDHGYNKQNYNGNISGIKWANASDKQAWSNGYDYDNVNRLKEVDFNQKNGSNWNRNAGIDYSLPEMTYDANGNILSLRQSALKLNSSATVDMLNYSYLPNSNKLVRVTDAINDPSTKLGDFKDGANTGDDYAYDANGSMVLDNNKSISSIGYNHLNLPQTITVTGKGTIEYVYDAGGNKLQKKVTEGTTVTTTDYVSGFVYHNDILQFTGHEEGRIRYAKKYYYTGDSAYEWHYDYFYKDHLGNIRAVVTEQKDTAKYIATFETEYRDKEGALFTNINETAFLIQDINKNGIGSSCPECIVPLTGTNYPEDNTTNPNAYASRLNGNGKRIGAAITLKVMAGDKVDLGVKTWYPQSEIEGLPAPGEPEDVLTSLINTLSGSTSGLSGGKVTATELSATTSPFWAGVQSFLDTHTEDGNTPETPKAYLNWILFDEQFKYVPEGSGFIAVPGFNEDIQTLANSNLPVVKSGYLFVYLSNETRKRDVFFDNLVVQHYTGPLSETTDYTAWGLDMKMIGSKAFGRLENKRLFSGNEIQSHEFADKTGLEFYDFKARNYAPQIGRFMQIDPEGEEENQESWNPYHYTYNNPVRFTDPDGRVPVVPIVIIIWRGYKAYRTVQAIRNMSRTESLGSGFGSRMVGKGLESVRNIVRSKSSNQSTTSGQSNSRLEKAQARADKLSQKQRPGEDFTKAGKDATKNVNRAKNNETMACESCKREVQNAAKHKKGERPPNNEAHVDHKNPKSNGGSGTPDNGQVLCRECNLEKGNRVNTNPVKKNNE